MNGWLYMPDWWLFAPVLASWIGAILCFGSSAHWARRVALMSTAAALPLLVGAMTGASAATTISGFPQLLAVAAAVLALAAVLIAHPARDAAPAFGRMLWLLGGFLLLALVTQRFTAAVVWTVWLMLIAHLYGGGSWMERYVWPLGAGVLALASAFVAQPSMTVLLAVAVAMPLFPAQHWYIGLYRAAVGADRALALALLPGAGALLLWTSELWKLPGSLPAWILVWLVLSALYGATKALAQVQVSNLIAHAAMVPAALITIGLIVPESLAQIGGQLQALSNTLVLGGLLLLASRLYAGPNINPGLSHLGGLASCAPRLAVTWAVFLFALMALPGAGGFAAHLLVLYGVSAQFPWLTFIGVMSLTMVAVYCLRALHCLGFGPPKPLSERQLELEGRASLGFGVLVLGDASIGLAPHWAIAIVS